MTSSGPNSSAEGLTFEGHAWVLETPGQPLVRAARRFGPAGHGEAVVEVLACGLCHTDLGYADASVRTKQPAPIVLGHEVVGRIVAVGEGVDPALDGVRVIVPAVLPCGSCAWCRAGRGNACPNQKMPGNDIDGGFATHLVVPAAPLVSCEAFADKVDLRELSVVADAVSTAYQAILRAELRAGDLAVVVGAGGVGGFVVQIAHALGARVIACDVSADRLGDMASHGADHTICVADQAPRDVRKQVRGLAREHEIPGLRLSIFECSGHAAGQVLAYTLLDRGATLLQVGYTPEKVNVRLSNLMAFDATIHGTWGCPPEAYPAVLEMISDGRVTLTPFVEHAPMSAVGDLLQAMASGHLERRMILDPQA